MATNTPHSVSLPEDLHLAVQALAERRHQTPDALLLTAIQDFIGRQEQLDQLDRDTLEAWQDFEETGLHLSNEEVMAWLRKRAAGEDVNLPECHL